MRSVVDVDTRSLALSLIKSESEREVIRILKEYGYWNNPDHWREYGDNENNFSIIGNQQNSPDAALVEKIINSVDAVLMKKCLEKNVSPTSKLAPDSVESAVSDFFNVPEGKLTNITTRERRELARNIKLIATGTRSIPNYIIADKGEGQTPQKLPETILSLSKSNKLRIPFVQGKFNMGGSGVLQFCGKNNLQLILSKRSPNITSDDPTKDYWGFTIVRRVPPSKGKRSSVYNYLAPNNNQVLQFRADELAILPSKNKAYEVSMRYGTFIKLYEYKIPGISTNILLNLYNRLSILMPQIALPIRLYETRDYKSNTSEATLSGLSVRVEEDKRNNIEEGFPLSSTVTISGQPFKVSIIAFKANKEDKYKKSEGIIFLVNGQTHGTIGKTFFRRQKVGMGAIADSLLLVVDCTQMHAQQREDLFMNSRDRLREGELKRNIEIELEYLIRTNPALRDLREKRRKELLDDKFRDEKPLTDVIQKVMNNSPTLSKLFIAGQRLSSPFNLEATSTGEKFKSSRFPTYFRLPKKRKNYTKNVPINIRTRIELETDAENEYFIRDNEPGENKLFRDGEVEDASLNLYNGIATLNIRLPVNSKVGDEFFYELNVTDPSRVEPFKERFILKVVSPQKKRTNGNKGHRVKPPGDSRGDSRNTKSKLSMPNVKGINKKEWEKFNFNEHSSLRVDRNGEEYDFIINMDNIHLLTEIKSRYNESTEMIKNQYKYGMVLIGLGILNYIKANPDIEESISIGEISQMISPMLLPMIHNLGELEI